MSDIAFDRHRGGSDDRGLAQGRPGLAAEAQHAQLYLRATVRERRGIYPEILLACALSERASDGSFSATDAREPLQQLLKREVRGLANQIAALAEASRGAVLSKHGCAKEARYRFVDASFEAYVRQRGLSSERYASRQADEVAAHVAEEFPKAA